LRTVFAPGYEEKRSLAVKILLMLPLIFLPSPVFRGEFSLYAFPSWPLPPSFIRDIPPLPALFGPAFACANVRRHEGMTTVLSQDFLRGYLSLDSSWLQLF